MIRRSSILLKFEKNQISEAEESGTVDGTVKQKKSGRFRADAQNRPLLQSVH